MRSPGTSSAAGNQFGDGTGCIAAPLQTELPPHSPQAPSPPRKTSLEGICLRCKLPQITNCPSNILLRPRELLHVSHGHWFFWGASEQGQLCSSLGGGLCLLNKGELFHFSLSTLAAPFHLGAEAEAGVQPCTGRVYMSSPHRCDYRGIYSSPLFSGKQHGKDLGGRKEHKAGAKPPDGIGELGFTSSSCSISPAVPALLLCGSRVLVGRQQWRTTL